MPNTSSTVSIFELFDKIGQQNNASDVEEIHVEEISSEEPLPARPKAKRYEYKLEKEFANYEECQHFIDSENCWKVHDRIITNNGVKTIHWCNLVKCRGGRCLAEIYTKHGQVPGDERYFLYRRNHDHTCATAVNKVIKLPDEIQKSIEKYIEMRMLPRTILIQLRTDFPNANFEKSQVYSYYKKHRKALFGKSNTSVEDMIKFCEENSGIPNEPDKAFVLAYDHSPIDMEDETDDNIESMDDVDEILPWFRYIVSTKRLLENSSISKNICADSTKKIMLHKYQVLVFGTTDLDSTQRFHLMAVMVSKYEKSGDFEFGFKAIQNSVQNVVNRLFQPKFLMRDAAFAIHNAFIKVFGEDAFSLMCYAHVIRAVDRRPVGNAVNKAEIKKDVSKLRLAYGKRTFEIGCELFLSKWRNTEPEFAKYFEDNWIKHNSYWCNGVVYRMVKTNNGLENWNGILKRFHTHWKINGLNQFKVDLMDILSKESMLYEKDKAAFKSDVTISNNMRKEGFHFSKTKSIICRKGEDGKGNCYIRRGDSAAILSEEDVDDFLNRKYKTFDEFASGMFDLYIVTFSSDANTWKETAICTCPSFAENFICKHVMCMVYKLGLEKYRGEHALHATRPPGRSKNATPALVKD